MISTIIPTLNEGKYLANTLRALKNQDIDEEYEIIVADGKSRDNTVKIAKKYADKVITVRKKGPSAGRNAGAKIAKGDLLLFLDADTIVIFNCLSEFAKSFRRKKVVAVSCPILPLSPNLRDIMMYWIYTNFAKISIKSKRAQIAGICCAYKRNAFKKLGGFDERMHTCEDLDLSSRASKIGKIIFNENTFALTSTRRVEAWGRTKAANRYLRYLLLYWLGNPPDSNDYKPFR
jgi:GT2 family glycosyltransferase